MTNIVCFKWARIKTGYQLPNCCDYTAKHVNVLHNMARRHGTFDRFICVTDDPVGIDDGIDIVHLWDDYRPLGGCYNRLRMYAEHSIGPKFLMIDLDCVITGSIQHLLDRPESLVLNRYTAPGNPKQRYNGALQLVQAGAHADVWDRFSPAVLPGLMQHRGTSRGYVGSDQAWLSHYLGDEFATFGPEHGIRDIKHSEKLPEGTSIVFFHGARDPSMSDLRWVHRHWQ